MPTAGCTHVRMCVIAGETVARTGVAGGRGLGAVAAAVATWVDAAAAMAVGAEVVAGGGGGAVAGGAKAGVGGVALRGYMAVVSVASAAVVAGKGAVLWGTDFPRSIAKVPGKHCPCRQCSATARLREKIAHLRGKICTSPHVHTVPVDTPSTLHYHCPRP